jgi:CDP-diacylglycerol--serine O-phosphatidyltransferase
VVSFGVAPAVTLYVWGLDQARSFGWIAALLLGVCAALRLARFNVSLGAAAEKPAWAYNYFTGVPAPAGAGLAILPIIASFEAGPAFLHNPAFLVIWTIMVAALMISALPTFSLKGQRIPQRLVPFVLLGVGGGAAALVAAPWMTLSVIGVLYLVSLPFSIRQFGRLKAEAARLQERPAGPAPVDESP